MDDRPFVPLWAIFFDHPEWPKLFVLRELRAYAGGEILVVSKPPRAVASSLVVCQRAVPRECVVNGGPIESKRIVECWL